MADPDNPQGGETDYSGIVSADGALAEGWEQRFPESDREMLSRFKNFDDIPNAFVATKRKFGEFGRDPDSLIQLPKDDSPDEVKTAFYKAIGKPDTADGYKFEKSSDLSEKVEVVDAQIKAFAEIAHKYNLNNKQFNGVVNDYLALVGRDIDAFDVAQAAKEEQSRKEGVAILKQLFGSGYEGRILRAEGIRDKYGSKVIKDADGTEKTLIQKLEEENPGIKTSPWLRMIFDAVAESLSEDSLKGIFAVTTPTSGQIESKINELRQHPAYMDRAHPQHKEILKQISGLYAKKKPA